MAQIEPPIPPQREPALSIRGEVLELDELLNFAVVDVVDLESAAVWWDEHATPAWAGALDEAASDG